MENDAKTGVLGLAGDSEKKPAQEPIEKPIYIIGISFFSCGLFCIYSVCLSHILAALENGYIPVVDLKHYKSEYFKDGKSFKDNVWEYYFKQPGGLSLDDIDENSNVIIGSASLLDNYFNKMTDTIQKTLKTGPNNDFEQFNKIELNDETAKFLEENYQNITGGESEILGILCRGTDYTALRPHGHSIQPNVDDVIKKAKKLFKKYNYKKIYLATEDAAVYQRFQDEFGEILLNNPQYKYSQDIKKRLLNVPVERPNHAYNLGREYLLSIYILSKCKYLIGGKTSAIYGLYVFSEGFKNQKYVGFWNIGEYHNSNVIKAKKFLKPLFYLKNRLKEEFEKSVFKNRITGFERP